MEKRIRPAARLAALLLVLGVGGMAEIAAQSEGRQVAMPVTRVVLYTSGVGYFEHAGTVEGDALARFGFKTDQINDVLKSMVLRDFGGGSATAVNYASQDPLAKALRSFAIDLSDKPTMAGLLDKLRGAAVTLNAPQPIEGSILGVEQTTRIVGGPGQAQAVPETVLDLMTAEGLRAVPLGSVSAVKLADPRLNEELNRALALIIQAADTQRKNVDVRFSGKGKRQVAVSYVAEAPVWKTSYRLDLGGAEAAAKAPKGFLQGWAIVENTGDSDWDKVNLSLVSGSPVSFTMDLYSPLYVNRPAVAPMVQASVQPRSYDEGMKGKADDGYYAEESEMDMKAGAPAPAAAAPAPRAKMSLNRAMDLSAASAAPAATAKGEKFGELFNFAIAAPVSLQRRQSAMLPLVNQAIAAERLSIYNRAVLQANPMAGARIVNDSGLRLPPGPITVFDGGLYAGDALLDTLGPGDRRLVSFAVDLDLQVDPTQTSQSDITKLSIHGGVLEMQTLVRWSSLYRVQNRSDKPKTLLVEHRKSGGELLQPKEFLEDTPELYRFRVPLKAGMNEFKVEEQYQRSENLALVDLNVDRLAYFQANGKAGPELKAALAKLADAKRRLAEQQKIAGDRQSDKSAIENGQQRLRDNIATVGRDSPQGQRYLQKLSAEEDSIEKLAAQIQAARDQAKKIQDELGAYIKNLQVD